MFEERLQVSWMRSPGNLLQEEDLYQCLNDADTRRSLAYRTRILLHKGRRLENMDPRLVGDVPFLSFENADLDFGAASRIPASYVEFGDKIYKLDGDI